MKRLNELEVLAWVVMGICVALMLTAAVNSRRGVPHPQVSVTQPRTSPVSVKEAPLPPKPTTDTRTPKPAPESPRTRPAKSQTLSSRGGYYLTCVVSAYSANDPRQGTGDRTATGRHAELSGCAVDPRVIRLGSTVTIDGVSYLADDTGGAIKGRRIDIRLSSRGECFRWGRRTKIVRVSR